MRLADAKALAESLIAQHCPGYKFRFTADRVRYGYCSYNRGEIGMSRYLVSLNPITSVLDTILHEIAHALTPGCEHNEVWRAKAIELGANGKQYYDDSDTVFCPKKWLAVCTCGYSYEFNRMRRGMLQGRRTWICPKCKSPLELLPNMKYLKLNLKVAARTKRIP